MWFDYDDINYVTYSPPGPPVTRGKLGCDTQRHTHRKNDHESRYKRPQLKSNYKLLEGQAVDIYTKSIFCDVQAELIGVADCINQRYEDQRDGFVMFYVNDFQQPCTSLFEVNYGVFC